MKSKKVIFLVTILLLSIISILISNLISKTNTDTRSQAAQTPKISFPKDHIFHKNFSREWWYLNLLVRTDDNKIRDTGYIISFGKIGDTFALLTSKYDNYDKKFKEETYKSGTLTSTLGKNNLFTISYSQKNGPKLTFKELSPLQNGAKRYSLKGNSLQTGTLDLIFTENTVSKKGYNTPLLWGCNGNISVFEPNDTYYYSIPDLDITGTVKEGDGKIRNVKVGKAWIDHQWFNSSPTSDWKGHNWIGHHLTQRNDFIGPHTAIGAVTQIFSNGPKYSYWVKRNPDGTNDCGTDVNFQIKNKYSNNYPSQIKINITKSNKKIYSGTITPMNRNQVFTSSGIDFFEPMSYISGTLGKNNVTGLGFFETAIK